MEALWSLEDKWKLSTQKAIALFSCTSFLVIGLCLVAVALKRRRKGSVHQEPCKEAAAWAQPLVHPGWRSVIVKVLMGSARWSRRSKWEESLRGETPRPLLVKREGGGGGGDGGRQSHNSASAVWQRPILMGEKCELPRFSGLILYDQRGMPVHQCEQGIVHDQEKSPAVVRATLRDLL
ncbi:hypothetical protein Salat_0243400 [Sesamum alatum]|uniref:Uncharacterized protein n=1 Tax=Sesamum alatum TaxID=300844 RepID=A0AAE2CYB0_9LAMI|nr:hypothetical protein Salat_0243400 [Sesamum alatum]